MCAEGPPNSNNLKRGEGGGGLTHAFHTKRLAFYWLLRCFWGFFSRKKKNGGVGSCGVWIGIGGGFKCGWWWRLQAS